MSQLGASSTADVVVFDAWLLSAPEGYPIIALAYFALKALLLYPPQAIVMR